MNVVVLGSPRFQHGMVQSFAAALAAALRAEGVAVAQKDYAGPADARVVIDTVEDSSVDAIVTFSSHATDRNLDPESNIYNRTRARLLDVYLDPMLLYVGNLDAPIRRRTVVTSSADGLDRLRPYVFPGRPILHLAHAADPAPPTPWADRDIDLLFVGSLGAEPEAILAEWQDRPLDDRALLEAMKDEALAAENPSLAEIVFRHVDAAGADATLRRKQDLGIELDRYLRAHLRRDAIAELLDRPLVVAGAGWEGLAGKGGRARFVGALPAAEARALFRRARVVLNVMPAYHGSHERVFDAMAAAAAAVTARSPFFADAFAAEELETFAAGPGRAAAAVARLLDDPARARDAAEAGARALVAGHTWRHRARRVLDILAAAD